MFESERRDLAWVPRWSIVRVNRRQSVAEHSYFVVAYGLEIARLIGWPDTGDVGWQRYLLATYLVRHDEDESITGDIPGPVKTLSGYSKHGLDDAVARRFGQQQQGVTNEMRKIKQAADLMDECMYLAGEVNSGNRSVALVLKTNLYQLSLAISQLPATAWQVEQVGKILLSAIDNEMVYNKDVTDLQNARLESRRSSK